ncbi:regulatory iron-sulfur-containing complex subunit RicT, partial [Roseisolibacter sp. H3M3-2]|uniref:PSP1 domain-containing protein n=1 Tax=Roseisolibacter sp. H3M3-2 TaxID=3031323 RepID=UPI0023D9B15C
MAHLVEIAFKGNRKEFYLWDGDDPPKARASVIVEGDRGEDLGEVHATGELAAKRWAGVAHGEQLLGAGAQPQRRALRLAADEDVRRAGELAALNEEARRKSMERVRAHGLVMKISDADWQWDRRKLTLFFTAEKRVDFRALVRDLAALFRTRIELKQIGVRDEAKRLDGVGRCGRQYCSAAWLPELRPVNLSVAKDQRLSLNPTQISGACGRLMCSLRYEHEFYVQQRKRFPKEGKVLATAKGEEKVVGNDIFRERVTLRALDGEVRVLPLGDLRRELEALGSPFAAPPAAEPDEVDATAITGEHAVADDAPRPERLRGERRGGERRDGDRRTAPPPRPRPPVARAIVIGDLEGVSLDGATQEMPVARLPLATPAPVEAPSSDVETPEGDAPEGQAPAAEGGEEGARPRRRRGRRRGRRNRGGRG